MKLSELMTNYTPNADYEGWVTNDDYVFAINLTPETASTAVTDFAVVEMGIAGLDAQLNPITQDKTYIRAGQNTMKTGTQRSFSVTGDRYVGDEAQDYCLAHATKYGTGNKVVTDYVYFNVLTGKGEKGQCSIIVNSDQVMPGSLLQSTLSSKSRARLQPSILMLQHELKLRETAYQIRM